MPAISHRRVVITLAMLGAFGVLLLFAGDLEPPGPPAPTMKTLDDVEPRFGIRQSDMPLTITVPGSYYLMEDLSAVSGGITINTVCVTVDFNGFALFGGFAVGSGVTAGANAKNVEIRNGAIADWLVDGIDLSNATNSRVYNMRVIDNVGRGVVLGDNSMLRDSLVNDNGAEGVSLTGSNSVVRDNLINGNATGVLASAEFNQVADNSIIANGTGIRAAATTGNNLMLVGNLLQGNMSNGIDLSGSTSGHITSRNLTLSTSGTNYPFQPADFGPEGTAAASTSPWANIGN